MQKYNYKSEVCGLRQHQTTNHRLQTTNLSMFIYNVTIKVNWSIHEAWVKWMRENHIPDVMSKGCFTEYRFVRVLETDDTEGPTYATQYYADSMVKYNVYIEMHAPALRKDSLDKWGDNFIGFRSLMEVVH